MTQHRAPDDADDGSIDGAATTPTGRIVRIGGQSIELGGFALLLMLVAILVPPVQYAMHLGHPTSAELLVAISVGMFASVLYLWVLDVSSTLKFRSPWVSRAIYGAAITSILGTSVGVYKDSFSGDQHPYQGEWLVTVYSVNEKDVETTIVARRSACLAYSAGTKWYWGYCEPEQIGTDSMPTTALEITRLDIENNCLETRLRQGTSSERVIELEIEQARATSLVRSNIRSSYRVAMARRP